MSCRRAIPLGVLAAISIALFSPAAARVVGQAPAGATKSTYESPRTPWGDPDIHGVWDFQTRMPLERPTEYADKPTLSGQELANFLKKRTPGDQWNGHKFVEDNRTSLIIDPPNGRIPLTADGRKRYEALEEYRRVHQDAYETWEEVGSYERCISRVTPRLFQNYDSGTIIVQSPGWVGIISEQLDQRTIPLDSRPHLDADVRQWNGDSRGHWEGNTLVIETTNFTDKQKGWPPFADDGKWRHGPNRNPLAGQPDQLGKTGVPAGNMKLIERFEIVGPKRMNYYATTIDPTWYSQPWTLMLPWEREDNYQMYEYACSEGNLAVENALRGARVQEREAAQAAKKQSQGAKPKTASKGTK